MDVGAVEEQLAAMVQGRLRDPTVAVTLLPTFTTTTPHDQATAAMTFLGTMKMYFSHGVDFGCSFPSVTLLGKRRDWADMLERVAWFGTLDHEETAAWTVRLTKVLEYMVASFDRPDDADVRRFWTLAVHEARGALMSGLETLSGWLTAFCWWGPDGKRVRNYSDEELVRHKHPDGPGGYRRLTLDGVEFPVMERMKVPRSVVRAPVTLYQDGTDPKKAALLAGSVGMQVMEEDGEIAAQPASGWWLLSTSEKLPRNVITNKALYANTSLGLATKRRQSKTATNGDPGQEG